MKTQKLSFKIVYCLAGLIIMVSLGFNIYQHQRNKEFFTKSVPEKTANNVFISESSSITNSAPAKAVQKNIIPVSKAASPASSDINKLEDNLNSTEQDLDSTGEELSEELSKRAEFKKAYKQFSKNMASDPAYQKTMRETLTESMLKEYEPLFKKLGISREEFDEFKSILADRMMEIQNAVLPNTLTASDEEKAEMDKKIREINNKYKDRVNNFLGQEKSAIYVSYQMRFAERSSLNFFMDSLPPDNRISEDQTEALIDTMYAARKTIYDDMGPDIDMNFSTNLTEENIAHEIKKTRLVYDRWVEATRGILSDAQVEQYKNYLKRIIASTESMYKTRLFMNKNN